MNVFRHQLYVVGKSNRYQLWSLEDLEWDGKNQ